MKRGKNNKAKLGVTLLNKIRTAEAVIIANIPNQSEAQVKTYVLLLH